MGSFIAKQPNGLYCRFSSIVDCPTHWNMTEEDYIEYCIEIAIDDAKFTLKNYVQPCCMSLMSQSKLHTILHLHKGFLCKLAQQWTFSSQSFYFFHERC
jgi:hypothetical protein